MASLSVELIEPLVQTRVSQPDEIQELAHSLEQQGQISPIGVRPHPAKPEFYQLIFGNRRLAAAKKLGWKKINADVVNASDEEALIIAFSENINRADLSDYEKGLFLQRLHNLSGKTYSEIAKSLGKSISYVSLHVDMVNLFPASVAAEKDLLAVLTNLSERHARALAKIEDCNERWATAKLAIRARLGVRELEKYCCSPRRAKTHSKTAEVKTIQQLIMDMMHGYNSKNIAPFIKIISPEDYTKFSRFPPFEKLNGISAKEALFDVLRKFRRFHVEIQNLEIVLLSKSVALATFNANYCISISGRRVNTTARTTMVFVNKEAEWKLLHEHWSPPPCWHNFEIQEPRTLVSDL